MILSAARTKLRHRLDEMTAGGWSDTTLNIFINDAATDIARRTFSLQDEATLTIDSGDNSVVMPADIMRVYMVLAYPTSIASGNDPHPLTYADKRAAAAGFRETGTGTPRVYSTWGFPPSLFLQVYPRCDSDYEFKLFYYRLPTAAVADGDTVEVANGWDDLLIDGAEYMARIRDRDKQWADTKNLYEQKIQDAIENMSRWQEENDMIQTPTGLLPSWLTSWE